MKHVSRPWWASAGRALLSPHTLAGLSLSALWDLNEQLAYVRDHVQAPLLAIDFAAHADLPALWASLVARGTELALAVGHARTAVVATLQSGTAAAFRHSWEDLGFVERTVRASTAADDQLGGLLELQRIAIDE